MRFIKRFSAFFIFLCWVCPVRAEETVEGVAAIVTIKNREPIRYILFFSDIERYRLFFAPSIEQPDLAHQLTEVINHRLFRPEAKRFILDGPTPMAVEVKFQTIRTRFQNDAAFQQALLQTGFIEDDLKAEIREHLWVDRLLKERIEEFIFISPKSIETYFREHPDLFEEKNLEDVKETIEIFLTMEKETQKKADYVKRLKTKAEIKILME